MRRRILVVEDDDHLADGIRLNLELEGFEPVVTDTGEDAWRFVQRGGIDLILLDVMLPGMDGFEFCRRVRREGFRFPILFLTARSREEDRIRGLEEGGDDYLTKPFNLKELLARIRGIFRREDWYRRESVGEVLEFGGNRVNLKTYAAETPRGAFELKEKEIMILKLLAERQGEPVDRATIINLVWGYDVFPTTRTVDNFILSLRKVIEVDPSSPQYLQTVHGVGYRLLI